jgi:hypothetical protein
LLIIELIRELRLAHHRAHHTGMLIHLQSLSNIERGRRKRGIYMLRRLRMPRMSLMAQGHGPQQQQQQAAPSFAISTATMRMTKEPLHTPLDNPHNANTPKVQSQMLVRNLRLGQTECIIILLEVFSAKGVRNERLNASSGYLRAWLTFAWGHSYYQEWSRHTIFT